MRVSFFQRFVILGATLGLILRNTHTNTTTTTNCETLAHDVYEFMTQDSYARKPLACKCANIDLVHQGLHQPCQKSVMIYQLVTYETWKLHETLSNFQILADHETRNTKAAVPMHSKCCFRSTFAMPCSNSKIRCLNLAALAYNSHVWTKLECQSVTERH